jgi:hypothetical protein
MPWLSNMSLDLAISIIDLYRSIDAFPSEPGIPLDEFDNWSAMLVRCGVMPADVAADGLLDFANSAQGPRRAASQSPPPA